MSEGIAKVRIMSGARVTGHLHMGHYFGVLRNWVALQDQYECYFGIMDWHGMTTAYKSTSEFPNWNRDMFAEILAWGIDPQRATVFVQSWVPEHLEMFMILANMTPMGWLERVNTWKDAEEEAKQNDTHNLGRFAYPVLQAADIAIYKGAKVPIGQDQVSHLEITREIIRRLNKIYKGKIPEPTPLLTDTPSVPGLDGRKMSKSYDNGIGLSDDEKTLAKKIRGMPTDPARVKREDPGDPEKCNVYTYHRLFSNEEDRAWVRQGCTTAGIGCGDCKGRLISRIEELVAQPRERKKELLKDPNKLDSMMREGSERARKIASETLREVKGLMKINS